MSSETSIRRLSRDVAVYAIVALLTRAISFVLLPLYTRFLTPADYGVLQLLDMLVEVTNILFAAGTTAGMQRLYFQAKTESERQSVVFTTFALHMGLTVAGAAAVLAFTGPLRGVVLGSAGSAQMVRLSAVNFVLSSLSTAPLLYAQTQQRPLFVSMAMLARLVVQVAANLWFVVHLRLGVLGALYGSLIGNGLVGLVMSLWLIRRSGIRFDRHALRELREFGLPYQLTFAGSFILTFGDRFFLQRWQGVAAVGLYSIAYQFGFVLHQMTTAVFNRAWIPQRYQLTAQPRELRDAQYNRGFLFFNLLLVSGAVGIAVLARPVIRIMTTEPYYGAAPLVPIILAAYVVQSWGEVVKFGIDVSGKTRFVSQASWLAVGVILVLYVTLIKPFGGMGAAIATLVAFLVRFVALYAWSQRVWPVSYDWKPALISVVAGSTVTVVAFLLPDMGSIGGLLVGSLLFVLYGGVVFLYAVPNGQRESLLRLVRSPTRFREILG